MSADVPSARGTDSLHSYADRLLRLWATDSVEADEAHRRMGSMAVRPDHVPEDVATALSDVRDARRLLHRPMIDCGHCWAERHGRQDRQGRWEVCICEECDQPWPCDTPTPPNVDDGS